MVIVENKKKKKREKRIRNVSKYRKEKFRTEWKIKENKVDKILKYYKRLTYQITDQDSLADYFYWIFCSEFDCTFVILDQTKSNLE